MASFSVTYNTMLKWDIKHTHFGRPTHLQYRSAGDFPNFEELRRIRENKQLRQRIIKGKQSTYHKREIPDAPAFREVSEEDLDEIVDRLCAPTIASQGITSTSESLCETEHQQHSARVQKPRTPRDQDALVSRLSASTHMSRMRAEMEPMKIVTEVNKGIASNSLLVERKEMGEM